MRSMTPAEYSEKFWVRKGWKYNPLILPTEVSGIQQIGSQLLSNHLLPTRSCQLHAIKRQGVADGFCRVSAPRARNKRRESTYATMTKTKKGSKLGTRTSTIELHIVIPSHRSRTSSLYTLPTTPCTLPLCEVNEVLSDHICSNFSKKCGEKNFTLSARAHSSH